MCIIIELCNWFNYKLIVLISISFNRPGNIFNMRLVCWLRWIACSEFSNHFDCGAWIQFSRCCYKSVRYKSKLCGTIECHDQHTWNGCRHISAVHCRCTNAKCKFSLKKHFKFRINLKESKFISEFHEIWRHSWWNGDWCFGSHLLFTCRRVLFSRYLAVRKHKHGIHQRIKSQLVLLFGLKFY